MTSDFAPVPSSEDGMGTHLSRLARPFILAVPLMIVVLLPAALYGRRSQDVAAEADRALVGSLISSDDDTAVTIDPEMLCDPSAAATFPTTFAEIDVSGDRHKASVTGLAFDSVTVDLKGWVDEPSGPDRDDIMIRMERAGNRWCVADVKTLVAATD